ncbi:hypothetical protein E1B28_011983 [Marasmius oreades]|uniref:DUF6534 domain-containing protein n=1 Tax=Marasmius oreades TaxID=181124 RepID=A0A9P7RR98_9AGAR|nr:uncharacterized protein E1B28_011983 [Marasmius oreades]KAG7087938.1 hypothetical protein E1B28_011983 [Marasmius oreades]
MEALQTAWVARKLYLFSGSGFGNVTLLFDNQVDWADEAFVIKTGIVGLLCQCFSAWRIWVLSRSKIMIVSVVILSLLSTAATFVGGAHIIQLGALDLNSVLTRDTITIIWATCSALCDTTISIFMGLILKRSKVRVQQGTRTLITKVLWLTVTTGALTALMMTLGLAPTAFMALSALVLLLISPRVADSYLPIIMLMGKVESNSYLAVLNSRLRLGSRRDDTHTPYYSAFAVASAGFEVELGNSRSRSLHRPSSEREARPRRTIQKIRRRSRPDQSDPKACLSARFPSIFLALGRATGKVGRD